MLMAHRPTPLWGKKPHWKSDYNYPKKAEYYIFKHALELLTESCFEFVNKYEPDYQHRRRIECAESFELTVWLDYIREELVMGNISCHNLRGGARLNDFESVANQVRLLRNDTFHQGLRTSEFLSENLTHGIELARMLGDERRTRQLESMREDLDKGSLFVEYLQSRLATELERDVEMGILEKVLIVLLQRLRDTRDEYQSHVVALRAQYKNEYGIALREKMLKIRGPVQLETSAQKAEGQLSFEEWQEERERSVWRNEAETPQSDVMQENQHEHKSSNPPADSQPFEHFPRTSGQPLGLRKSWLSPDADIESKESDAPTTAEAESTTRDPDEVSPSGSAAEAIEKGSASAKGTKKQGYYIWKPQAVSEDLVDSKIPSNQNSPDAPTPQHTKSSPAPPAFADSKKKYASAAPTAAATAAGKESKDAKQAAPPTNEEVLDFTEVYGNQITSSSHRLK
ncbi:uncharacterized protein J3D65DRAFT_600610 [Phyllosticta citribraziliensis]|uniref:DZIP3-like HEPN domain-containing protein n=1 Tax=Phyllosticta citribraziliensis TaxID=989973 RepID=A0ABR1LZ23_9PEZI